MFDDEDRAYFARRAAVCRTKEQDAIDPSIRDIHRDMAEEYERRASGQRPRNVLRLRIPN